MAGERVQYPLTFQDITPGRVIWLDLKGAEGVEQKKIRPCIVVHCAPLIQPNHTVYVVPVSRVGWRRVSTMIAVQCYDIHNTTYALCDQMRAVDWRQRYDIAVERKRLEWEARNPAFNGFVSFEEMDQVLLCLGENLYGFA